MQVMLRCANALVTLCFRVLSHYLHDPGAIPRPVLQQEQRGFPTAVSRLVPGGQ